MQKLLKGRNSKIEEQKTIFKLEVLRVLNTKFPRVGSLPDSLFNLRVNATNTVCRTNSEYS